MGVNERFSKKPLPDPLPTFLIALSFTSLVGAREKLPGFAIIGNEALSSHQTFALFFSFVCFVVQRSFPEKKTLIVCSAEFAASLWREHKEKRDGDRNAEDAEFAEKNMESGFHDGTVLFAGECCLMSGEKAVLSRSLLRALGALRVSTFLLRIDQKIATE